jgi:hypothetical protein
VGSIVTTLEGVVDSVTTKLIGTGGVGCFKNMIFEGEQI